MRSVTPTILKRSRHTWPVNTGSLSLTMEEGNPCSRTIPSKKAWATDAAGRPSTMKWAYLEKRSTTVRMTDSPPPNLRQPLDEVERDVDLDLGRHLEGLQQSGRP
ncbi:LOW QUALITY PROTEIN: hypothetical protein U9M48_024668 [Paspalum notatum var. saurae]|uniref:Uncharacterized protein n=1 Tax=Paspalum notatum var. saurae TaxID=547442 RepID=A0AAQ3WX82_PASNO